MAVRFLDDAARAAFQEAIEAIEQGSAAEVVVALRRQSAGYLMANVVVGALAAFAGLAYTLFSEHRFSLPSILIDPFAVGLLAGGLVELVAPLKRVLAPRRMRRAAVERGAKAAFFDRGVANTRGRTGVLVYLSWLEGEACVLADAGVPASFRDEGRAALERKLTAEMARGGAAVAQALRTVAEELATALPRREDDINELPDAIDADLGRAPRGGA
ncbi:MAG: hypothetical protein R3B48_13090 [Kofleriaceae bacterium]